MIGDNADTPFSGLAQTALHDATFVADNFSRAVRGRRPLAYRPYNPPMVVPIGRRWAVFEWRKLRLNGVIGAILRRFADLIGYSDILPLSRALAIWQWGGEPEDAYFTPSTGYRESKKK